jgi:hypothetical protein
MAVEDTTTSAESGPPKLNDRLRLLFLLAGNAVLTLVVAFSVWTGSFTFVTTVPGKPQTETMTFGHIAWFFGIEIVILAFSAGLGGGSDWSRRIAGYGLHAIGYLVSNQTNPSAAASSANPDNRPPIRILSDGLRATPLAPASLRHAVALRALVTIMCAALVTVTVRTGGTTVSPFTQLGITVFVLSMLLTNALAGRILLSLAAIATLSVGYAVRPNPQPASVHVDHRTFLAITLVNVGIQLMIGAAGATKLWSDDSLFRRHRVPDDDA